MRDHIVTFTCLFIKKSKMSSKCILFFFTWFVTTMKALSYGHSCPDKNIAAVKVCENGKQEGSSIYLYFDGGNKDLTETCVCNLSIHGDSNASSFNIEPLYGNTSEIRIYIAGDPINDQSIINSTSVDMNITLNETRDPTCIAGIYLRVVLSYLSLQCFVPDKSSMSSTLSTMESPTWLSTQSSGISQTATVNMSATTIRTYTEDSSTDIYVIASSLAGATVVVGIVIAIVYFRTRRTSNNNFKSRTKADTDNDDDTEMTANTACASVADLEGGVDPKAQSNEYSKTFDRGTSTVPSEIDEYAVVRKKGQIITNDATPAPIDPIYNHLNDQGCEINDNGNIYDKTGNTSSCVYDHTNSVTSRVNYEDDYYTIKRRTQNEDGENMTAQEKMK